MTGDRRNAATRRLRAAASLLLGVTFALAAGLALPSPTEALLPAAVDDDATVTEDAPAAPIDVLANDTVELDTLVITGATDPGHGTVVVAADGLGLTYQPDPDFFGADAFDYTATESGNPTATSSATVDVTVTPVNDRPVANDDPGPACFDLSLFDGAFPVVEDHRNLDGTDEFVLGGDCGLLANDADADGDSLTYEILTQPANGEATRLDDVFFAYRPDPDFSTVPGDQPGGTWHSDSFTYRAFDGTAWSEPATVRFWIAPINDPPTFTPAPTVTVAEDSGAHAALWATDVSPGPAGEEGQHVQFVITSVESHGVVNLFAEPPDFDAAGNLTFTPGANEHGFAHVTVHAVDDGGLETYPGVITAEPPDDTSDPVTFDIVVSPVNDAPNAVNDGVPAGIAIWTGGGPTTLDVLANDTSAPDGSEALTIVGVTQGSRGTVAIGVGGSSVTYEPAGLDVGLDLFTYTISDGNGGFDTATVQVLVTADTTAPVVASPRVALAARRGAPAIRAVVSWSAHETQSGIAAYRLQRQVDGGTWSTISLPTPTSTSISLVLASGHGYRFRVRATDGAGNVGIDAVSRRFRL